MEGDVIDIESVVAGGDGMGRHPEGFVVFVRRTIPGERVQVEFTEEHRQWRRARATRVLEAAPARRAAPCRYYEQCGGCHLQHMTYTAQVDAKASIIRDTLRRIGKVDIAKVEVEPSPRELGYRNRISFALKRTGGSVSAGYHALDDPARLVDIEACPLAEAAINDVWKRLRESWGEGAGLLPPGDALRVTLRAAADGNVGLAIEGASGVGDLDRLLRVSGPLAAVWVIDEHGSLLGRTGVDALAERWGDYDIRLSGTAFLQVHREMAIRLDTYVRGQVGSPEGLRVVDAYCGFGLRTLELAGAGADVVAIDVDRRATRIGRAVARDARLTARFVAARVDQVLESSLPADLVVLNPPRNGIGKRVCDMLLRNAPPRVVYISCDPATLARDIRILASRYEVAECRGFDLFPQTAHVETVVTLVRRERSPVPHA